MFQAWRSGRQSLRGGLLWRAAWILFALALYTPFIDLSFNDGNVASDMAAIESLVHRHTLFIDASPYVATIDKLWTGTHFISQKSPIFHVYASLPLWPLEWCGFDLNEHRVLFARALTIWVVILPMGWLLWLIFSHPWARRLPTGERAALTIVFALGSLMTPFAVTLNHYVLAAACLMKAVHLLSSGSLLARGVKAAGENAARAHRRSDAALGFWISASLACDVPGGFLLGAIVGGLWLWRAPRRIPALVAGAAPLMLLYAAFNACLMGTPLPATINEEAMLYYPGSYWAEVRAARDAGHPTYYETSYLMRLWHACFGHRGVYWMMPLLVPATMAAVWLRRRRAPGWAPAMLWAIFLPLLTALTMIFAWDLGGGSYVIRNVLVAVPPLFCVLAHPALVRIVRRHAHPLGWTAGVMAIPVIWGCLIAALGVSNPWSANSLSAFPPLHNLARLSHLHGRRGSSHWVGAVIDATAVSPEIGWFDWAILKREAKDYAGAEQAFKRAIEIEPTRALAYYHLGIVQDMQRHPLAAAHTYEKLLALDPGNVGAWNNLGVFAIKLGDRGLAKQTFERSLTLAPDNALGLWGELLIAEGEGRGSSASPQLQHALELYPRDMRIKALARRWKRGEANPYMFGEAGMVVAEAEKDNDMDDQTELGVASAPVAPPLIEARVEAPGAMRVQSLAPATAHEVEGMAAEGEDALHRSAAVRMPSGKSVGRHQA